MNADTTSTEYKLVRAVIVDDHSLYRAGLKYMLADESNIEVVGEAMGGQEALELCRCTQPNLVFMDLRMPRMDGITATRLIKREYPQTSVLVITMYENPNYLLEALQAGAAGYILKDADYEEVTDAIRQVISGNSPLAPELSAQLLRRLAREVQELEKAANRPKHKKLLEPLTAREIEVLEQLIFGGTNRQLAQEFGLSMGTVKNHVEHIMRKLEVSDRTQAVVRALQLGIIFFPEWDAIRLPGDFVS